MHRKRPAMRSHAPGVHHFVSYRNGHHSTEVTEPPFIRIQALALQANQSLVQKSAKL
jgi:hypothetical protein